VSRADLAVAVLLVVIAAPAAVSAQSVEPVPGRFEVAVGAQWLGSASLGSQDATLTTSAGSGFTLFKTESAFGNALGLEGRLAVRVRPGWEAEAFGAYAAPAINTLITADAEGATSTTASESVKRFAIGGGVLWYLPRLQSARLRPFVLGSGAYVRELHDANMLAANGASIDAGGGVKYVLYTRPTGRLRTAGLRGDARLEANIRGVAFAEGTRFRPVLTASAFFRY
jgi:hypothetical protein